MPDAVYPKYALRATGENQLKLSDAEQIYLRDCLDNQLISSGISGISQEIVHAVFRQTIRYNKREDDLCGSRLADMISTESKPYYCNLQVRQLAAESVLIARDGHYGRILAINFNFAQWGQSPAENGDLICDPEGFCAKTFDSIAPSSPIINPEKPATTEDIALQTETTAIDPQLKPQTAPQEPQTLENKQIGSLQAAIQSLTAEVATLKALLQDVLPNVLPKNNDKNVAERATEQAVEARLATLEPCELHSHTTQGNEDDKINDDRVSAPLTTQARENEDNDAPVSAPLATQARENEDSDGTISAALATLERCARHSQVAHENEYDKNNNKINDDKLNENNKDLSFPNALKPHEKNAICKALEAENIKDKSTCQLLLDDLSSRFSISDWQPIRSPIGYFKSLIRNYKQGSFDDSYVEDFRSKQKAAETAQKEAQSTTERRAYLDKYNDAKNKYENLKMAAQSLGRTLRDIAKDRGWTTLIEEMGFDLDVAIPT